MRGHSVGYFSSYDRGLVTLLELWPEIRKQVPDATLSIAYGWNGFDEMHRSNPEQMKWKWQLIRELFKLKDQGVSELGRLSHQDLADLMKRTKVWAYPTTFSEINCITAIKAQAAGMITVTTGCYALAETILDNTYTVKTDNIDVEPDKKAEFVKAVVAALKSDYQPDPTKAIERYNWTTVASQWDNVLNEVPTTVSK